jgi:hypothetical protein
MGKLVRTSVYRLTLTCVALACAISKSRPQIVTEDRIRHAWAAAAEFRRAHSRWPDDDNRITVVFCGHQRLFVILQAPSNSVEDQSKDLSRIPSSATIQEVEIFPQPNPTWSC